MGRLSTTECTYLPSPFIFHYGEAPARATMLHNSDVLSTPRGQKYCTQTTRAVRTGEQAPRGKLHLTDNAQGAGSGERARRGQGHRKHWVRTSADKQQEAKETSHRAHQGGVTVNKY